MIQYDLVVIGTGTAAMVAAMRVRAAGWRVAVIDHRPFGGTCALRGCDPKKMLVGGAEALDHVRRMNANGVAGAVHIDWPALIAFKRTFTDPVPGYHEHRYREKGIDTCHGHARFIGRNRLTVNGQSLEARHVLIAAGAEPITLGIPGEEHFATNEDFLALERLPRRIVPAPRIHILVGRTNHVWYIHELSRSLTRTNRACLDNRVRMDGDALRSERTALCAPPLLHLRPGAVARRHRSRTRRDWRPIWTGCARLCRQYHCRIGGAILPARVDLGEVQGLISGRLTERGEPKRDCKDLRIPSGSTPDDAAEGRKESTR
jgi:hypothetical protein